MSYLNRSNSYQPTGNVNNEHLGETMTTTDSRTEELSRAWLEDKAVRYAREHGYEAEAKAFLDDAFGGPFDGVAYRDSDGIDLDGEEIDPFRFDMYGYDKFGYNAEGFDRQGRSRR